MNNRLHKSRTNKVIAGVCGGLGDYFDVDPTFVRVLFVLMVFLHGIGLLAYIVLWIAMPREESTDLPPRDVIRENIHGWREDAGQLGEQFRRRPPDAAATEEDTIAGTETPPPTSASDVVEPTTRFEPYRPVEPRVASNRQLLAGGILLILGVLLLLDNLHVFWWLNWNNTWPVVLIAIGLYLLYDRRRDRAR
ncbi:MAG TPA: PspC domain-containing protein [Chloroflexota bacterium]